MSEGVETIASNEHFCRSLKCHCPVNVTREHQIFFKLCHNQGSGRNRDSCIERSHILQSHWDSLHWSAKQMDSDWAKRGFSRPPILMCDAAFIHDSNGARMKMQIRQTTAVGKCMLSNFGDSGRQSNVLNGRKSKRMRADFCKTPFLKLHTPQRTAAIKCTDANPNDGGGDMYLLQRSAALERPRSYLLKPHWKHYLTQTAAAMEGPSRKTNDPIFDVDPCHSFWHASLALRVVHVEFLAHSRSMV